MTGLESSELEQASCLITVREVTVLSAANVDLLTLNLALTSHIMYLTQGKKQDAAVLLGKFK